MRPSVSSVLSELKSHADPRKREGMARYGISPVRALGVSVPVIRAMARRIGKQHDLALGLWDAGLHESRMLASLVDDPRAVSRRQMERWISIVDSWDVCDCVCGTLFDKTPFAWQKAEAWSRRKPEFVKRAAFSLMAQLAVHDKTATDARFIHLLTIVEREATDPLTARAHTARRVERRSRHFLDRSRSVHRQKSAFLSKAFDERSRPPVERRESSPDRLWTVVLASIEELARAAIDRAGEKRAGRPMKHRLALVADYAASETGDDVLVRHVEVQHPIDRAAEPGQDLIERVGLGGRAGKAVENHAAPDVGPSESLLHHRDRHVVGDELAASHERRGSSSEIGLLIDVLAEEIA